MTRYNKADDEISDVEFKKIVKNWAKAQRAAETKAHDLEPGPSREHFYNQIVSDARYYARLLATSFDTYASDKGLKNATKIITNQLSDKGDDTKLLPSIVYRVECALVHDSVNEVTVALLDCYYGYKDK